jgi:uncharacterized coiled-coil protein SlyX
MVTFIKKALRLGVLGVAVWSLMAWGTLPNVRPDRGEGQEGFALTRVLNGFEVSSAWGQGVAGTPANTRGRLVIHYPLLNAILLILLLIALLGVAWFLNQLIAARMKALEKRIAYLEYTLKELQARQQEDVDGLRRQIHNLPGRAKTEANKKDPEKDTYVGKAPARGEPSPRSGQ